MIAVLCGGVGAARLLSGLVREIDAGSVTGIVNTGDDVVMHGLKVCPDLDTITYTLAGAVNEETGWGMAGETWRAMSALERLDGGRTWFRLGDGDLATHLYRTGRLAEGASLAQVTGEIGAAFGLEVTLLPMSEDVVQTRVTLASGAEVSFQEYFVRLRHEVEVRSVAYEGAAAASPTPGVLRALEDADLVVVAPSNPVLSLGPVLALPGVAGALAARRERVVGVSPIVGGRALKGPADRLLRELGHEASAAGVARYLAGVLGTLVIDETDVELAASVEGAGVRAVVADTVMASPARARSLARTVLRAATGL